MHTSGNILLENIKEILDDNDSLSYHLASSKISSVYLYNYVYNTDITYKQIYNLITTILIQRYR